MLKQLTDFDLGILDHYHWIFMVYDGVPLIFEAFLKIQ